MAPELFVTMEANRLRELAGKVREYQETKGLSTAALCKLVPQVGSDKTYNRILAGDLKELDLDRQLANFEAAVQWIESIGDDAEAEEEIFDDLSAVISLKRAFLETRKETGNARCIFVLGPSGSGKTSARVALMKRYGSRLALVEANVAWKDSPGAMLGAMLRMLGRRELPASQSDRLERVVELLKETRRCVIVEEAHHLGPRCLNLVKTLINQTPGEFILIAIDTLWRRLESAAYEEARQLTGNRLAERIQLGREMKERDTRLLLERRLKLDAAADKTAILKSLAHYAPNYGRLAFVRDVLRRVGETAEGRAITQEQFVEAINQEVASR